MTMSVPHKKSHKTTPIGQPKSYSCGPLQHASLSDFKYFVIFTYDFSRKAWVFFMKKKNETFNKFKYFKQVVEAKTNAKIGYLRINKGGEFTLGTFNEFCKQLTIETIPHTSK